MVEDLENDFERLLGAAFSDTTLRKQLVDNIQPDQVEASAVLQAIANYPTGHFSRKNLTNTLSDLGYTPAELAAASTQYNRCNMKAGLKEGEAENLLKDLTQRLRESTAIKTATEALKLIHADKKLSIEERVGLAMSKLAGITPPPSDEPTFSEKQTLNIKRENLPKLVCAIMDYLFHETCEAPSSKHLFETITMLASVIGKRATFRNWGTDYYPNIAVAILNASGTNKTGQYNSLKRLLKAAKVPVSTPTTSTIEALVEHYCETIPNDKKRKTDEKRRLMAESYDRFAEFLDGEFVLIDEFRAFLMALLPFEQTTRTRNEQILCRLLDNGDVAMSTITGGVRIIGDSAFSFLGFAQADPWNTEVRSTSQQIGGFAGRIIPVNGKSLILEGFKPEQSSDVDCCNQLEALRNLLSGSASVIDSPFDETQSLKPPTVAKAITIYFGREGDVLGEAKHRFRQTELAKIALEHDKAAFELMEPKFLIQSAKVAAILMLAECLETHPDLSDGLDASKYIDLAFALVGNAHLSNHYHEVVMTEQGMKMDKIKGIIRRRPGCTKRDIVKYTNMETNIVDRYLYTLKESGDIISRPTPRTTKYYLSE